MTLLTIPATFIRTCSRKGPYVYEVNPILLPSRSSPPLRCHRLHTCMYICVYASITRRALGFMVPFERQIELKITALRADVTWLLVRARRWPRMSSTEYTLHLAAPLRPGRRKTRLANYVSTCMCAAFYRACDLPSFLAHVKYRSL